MPSRHRHLRSVYAFLSLSLLPEEIGILSRLFFAFSCPSCLARHFSRPEILNDIMNRRRGTMGHGLGNIYSRYATSRGDKTKPNPLIMSSDKLLFRNRLLCDINETAIINHFDDEYKILLINSFCAARWIETGAGAVKITVLLLRSPHLITSREDASNVSNNSGLGLVNFSLFSSSNYMMEAKRNIKHSTH